MKIEEVFSQLDSPKALAIGIGLAFLYYLLMYDDGTALERQIQNSRQQIEQSKSEQIRVQKAIEEVNKLSETKNKLGDKFEKLVKYIPEEFKASEQMTILSDEAKSAGASIVQLDEAGEGKKLNFYQEIKVSVNLLGSYSQIVLFLSNLTKTDKVFVMENMSFIATNPKIDANSQRDAINSVNFSGTFVGYRYLKDEEVKAQ